MKNIHLLSANSPVQTLGIGFELGINNYIFLNGIMQNIHITNNDEIKDGDWIYRRKDGYETIQKATFPLNLTSINKKIILTTDSKLIADGVQAIPVDFLEWFVKNPSCEEVEVKKWFDYESIPNTTYEIITPKEEPKQDFPMQKLIDIMENDEGLKPKQETLEEITEQIQKDCHKFVESIISKVTYQDATNTFLFMKLAELILKLKKYE